MKYLDEYRDPTLAKATLSAIHQLATRNWTVMEVCGGQTHTILRHGIDELLAPHVNLLHGPGCPVCVTPIETIDQAIVLAERSGVILCTFGDMLRVPGSHRDLFDARAGGGDVRIVYSPLDVLRIAVAEPEREVVFFAVGFETTAPTTAMLVSQAAEQGLRNLSTLVAHVRVPPALEAVLSADDNLVQGILAPGHVCTVMGTHEYEDLVTRFGVPIVITGFEPLDILLGAEDCVHQLESGACQLSNRYARSVRSEGNVAARRQMERIFEPVDRRWRGLETLPQSALALRDAYAEFDAARRFSLASQTSPEPTACRAGDVLRGRVKPTECPAFGRQCRPEQPLGAPMVSTEGACAAYYRAGRHLDAAADRETNP